jgi:hypothetical protein
MKQAVLTLLLVGCHASATPAPPPQPVSPLLASLEKTCGGCHPGVNGTSVNEMASNAATARHALDRVVAGQMPPPYGLPLKERNALVGELCAFTSSNASHCVDVYTLGTLPQLLRWPTELIGDILSRWKFSDDVAAKFDGIGAATSSPPYDSPTVDSILLVGAVDGCKELHAKDETFDVAACVQAILSRDFIHAVEPAP